MDCLPTKKGNGYYCPVCKKDWPKKASTLAKRECKPNGPGAALHNLIEKLAGASPDRKCGCEDRIRQMEIWGVSGCREHLDEITDWLVEQATKHKWEIRLPGIGWIARRTPETLQRWSCRQLALLAIRRAEKERT